MTAKTDSTHWLAAARDATADRREAIIRMVAATNHQRARVARLKVKLRDGESLLKQMETALEKLLDEAGVR